MKLRQIIGSAFVIGRRDFIATVYSKTFLFFLIGPLFPLLVGLMFGGLGARAERDTPPTTVAIIADAGDFDLLQRARTRLEPLAADRGFVVLVRSAPQPDIGQQREALLTSDEQKVLGVLDGGLADPHFTGAVTEDGRTVRQVGMFIDEAQRMKSGLPSAGKPMSVTLTDSSAGSLAMGRGVTARAGQFLLFFLTVFLAGMLLSQLIEEKSNKVIEVLAAAVPIDSIFVGKLFAMLVMSLIGIAVWLCAGALAVGFLAKGGIGALPTPAVGWPAFLALAFLYFTMNYLLIGSTFLGIGSQAATVREVQTLSMPVTMAQLVLFGLAQLAIGHHNSAEGLFAAVFPLSSAFAMIARAAELPEIWPHVLALLWQALWVALIIHLSASLFRRSVLKSGPAFRWPWQSRKLA